MNFEIPNETQKPENRTEISQAATGSQIPENHPQPLEPPSRGRVIWDWVRPLLILILVMTSFRSAIADWNDVPTGSMKPTILEGDRVVVNKLAYDLKVPFTNLSLFERGHPDRGDVVVLWSPENGKRLIKRVVGLPGDQLAMRHNRLFINGKQALYEPLDADVVQQLEVDDRAVRLMSWEAFDERRHPVMLTPMAPSLIPSFGPIQVPEGKYFVMGDNRDESRDSRIFGLIDRESISGRAIAVAFSLDRDNGYLPRMGRFFRHLP